MAHKIVLFTQISFKISNELFGQNRLVKSLPRKLFTKMKFTKALLVDELDE